MPPIKSVVPKKTGIQSLENLQWRYFGDNLGGAIANSKVSSREWWKHHESRFPLHAKLVKVVFKVPAASSKSEQVFSVAGNVVTPKRAKLNPENVEHLVVVMCNLRLLKAWCSETKFLPF